MFRQTTCRDCPRWSRRAARHAYLPAGAEVDFDHVELGDGEVVELGNTLVRAVATPGHAPAHNAYVVGDRRRGTEEPWLVFTGDSLLVGDVGRPDLHAGGDPEPAATRAAMARSTGCSSCPTTSSSIRATTAVRSAAAACPEIRSRLSASSVATTRPSPTRDEASFAQALLARRASAAGRPASDRRGQPARKRAGKSVSPEPLGSDFARTPRQFTLLVGLNAFVGAMVGLERSVLPLVGERDFGLESKGAILSFVVAFGVAKALANLAAGGLADRVGRKRLLVLGWRWRCPFRF